MEIVCPDCGQTFRAKNEAGETQGECPSCSATADVPSSPSDPADEGRAAAVSAVPPGAYALNDARTLWAGLVDSNAPPQMSIKTGRTHASAKAAERLLLRSRKVEQIPSEEGTPPDSDYELTGILGRGGMGVVYSARQASLDRDTAVKMILPEAAQDPDAVNKFLAEAMVLAELDHPNIPPVYDMGGREDGTLFYTMKQVRGVSTPSCSTCTGYTSPETWLTQGWVKRTSISSSRAKASGSSPNKRP